MIHGARRPDGAYYGEKKEKIKHYRELETFHSYNCNNNNTYNAIIIITRATDVCVRV